MMYFETPTHCIARNHKVASLATAKAIGKAYHDREEEDAHVWQSIVPQTHMPAKKVLMLMRHPVDRFLSACAMLHMTVEEGLASDSHYFRPQADFKADKIYRYPDQIAAFCKEAGLGELEIINRTKRTVLATLQERERIEKRYAKDMEIFNNLRGDL